MAERKYTADYVNYYARIELIQPLAHGKYIKEIYINPDHKEEWSVRYESNSALHICPYTGRFIDCKMCMGEETDENNCINYELKVSAATVADHANKCRNAGLEVKFFGEDDIWR